MDLNKAMIIGNVTRDPEMRNTPSGQSVCSFGVATNRIWKNQAGERQNKPEFHNIVAWAKLAETCSTYLKKGSKIYIEGRLQTRSWDDPSGVKKYRTEIICQSMIMLDKKGTTSAVAAPETANEVPPAESSEEEINVEDIPF
ncbi:MAG: single-stranded DNA-binding protein [Patescibacteria group bacterium]